MERIMGSISMETSAHRSFEIRSCHETCAIVAEMRGELERNRIIIEQTGLAVFDWDASAKSFYASPQMSRYALGADEFRHIISGNNYGNCIHPGDWAKARAFFAEAQLSGQTSELTTRVKCKTGSYIWCSIVLTCTRNGFGRLVRVVGTLSDVDELVHAESALKYRAEYDTLTGVYNASAFEAHARELIDGRRDKKFAIIRMDICRFKYINDLFGYEEGNELLRYTARLLSEFIGRDDVCGRLGGDVFAACVAYGRQSELTALTDRIFEYLSHYAPGYRVQPAFGICVVEERSVPVSVMCDWAKLALDTIKGSHLNHHAFYDETLREKQLRDRNIEYEMERALASGEFELYLQPKHDISTGRIVGAEALVRWVHPKDGVLLPALFIPLFEQNGFIVKLDAYMWEETCKALARWRSMGIPPVPVSVNMSRVNALGTGLFEKFSAITGKYGVSPGLIETEMTESTLADDNGDLYDAISELYEKGYRVSIDDFGSGYSSLNMLKDAPVSTVKLDREFLNEAGSSEKGKLIVRHIISMARDIDYDVVAEGVETMEQAKFLLDAGCSVAQGFYFSRPMPAAEFEKLLIREIA